MAIEFFKYPQIFVKDGKLRFRVRSEDLTQAGITMRAKAK
jgi:hypothetical protein